MVRRKRPQESGRVAERGRLHVIKLSVLVPSTNVLALTGTYDWSKSTYILIARNSNLGGLCDMTTKDIGGFDLFSHLLHHGASRTTTFLIQWFLQSGQLKAISIRFTRCDSICLIFQKHRTQSIARSSSHMTNECIENVMS